MASKPHQRACSLEYRQYQTYLQLLGLRYIITLAIQVIRIKRLDSLKHLLVMAGHQNTIGAFRVPWIERVIPNHSQSLCRERALLLDDVVQILIMSPAQHDIVESTARAIDAILGAVDFIVIICIVSKGLVAVDDGIVKGATHRKGVANNVPLTLGVEEVEQLAKIVYEACQLH